MIFVQRILSYRDLRLMQHNGFGKLLSFDLVTFFQPLIPKNKIQCYSRDRTKKERESYNRFIIHGVSFGILKVQPPYQIEYTAFDVFS